MTTPTDAIAGLRKWNDDWPHWQFTEHQHNALRIVLDHSDEAAAAIDALQARVKELEEVRERSWCIRCGTVTRDGECDCTIHGSCGEPNFVNYADAMQKSAREAHVRALRAERERDEAVALLVRVNALAQTQAWRRMPDGATFSTAPLAGDINTAIRRLAGPEKEGK